MRARPGGNQDARRGYHPASDSDATLDQSRRAFLDISDVLIGGQQVDVFLLPHLLDQIGGAFHHATPVHGMGARRDARKPGRRRAAMDRLGGADHRLGRHAADIHAGTADGAMADQRHALAGLCRGDRGGKSGGAGTNDNEIVVVIAGFTVSAAIVFRYSLVHWFFLSLRSVSRHGPDQ